MGPSTKGKKSARRGAEPPDERDRYELRAGVCVRPLVAGTPVTMFAAPHIPAAAEDRFARTFAAIWTAILPAERVTVLAHWAGDPEWVGLSSPRIAVLADWPGRGQNVAECADAGHELRFAAATVATAPDYIVGLAIAHELAHVWQFAAGRIPGRTRSAAEKEAHAVGRRWLAATNLDRQPPGGRDWSAASEREWVRANGAAVSSARYFAGQLWFRSDAMRVLAAREAVPGREGTARAGTAPRGRSGVGRRSTRSA